MTQPADRAARALLSAFFCALLSGAAHAQESKSDTEDWNKHVEKACTSPRYGLRLAAAKKVAQGGDVAIPAVRAWAEKNGANSLPVALVEAIADSGANGPVALEALHAWALDRDFYWRAQALRGLALRAHKDDVLRAKFAPVFAQFVEDPAWLMRTFARWIADDPTRDFAVETAQGQVVRTPEADPRAQTKLAALRGDARESFSALGDTRTFLGDSWGKRRAGEALAALKSLLGTDGGYRVDANEAGASLPETVQAGSLAGAEADNVVALARLADAIAQRDSGGKPECARVSDPNLTFLGGIEILSCKNGDFFLRWTADGLVQGGATPDCPTSLQIAPNAWQPLLQIAATASLPPQNGVVVCDKVRIQLRPDLAQAAVAPASLPEPIAEWLKQLAAVIEESGQMSFADALRQRLGQFVMPAKQAR